MRPYSRPLHEATLAMEHSYRPTFGHPDHAKEAVRCAVLVYLRARAVELRENGGSRDHAALEREAGHLERCR